MWKRAEASSTPCREVESVARAAAPGPDFYVASRAHHADVGGAYPGSMGLCREIYQEGVRIPPVKLMRRGAMDADVLAMLLNNVRTPEEREGDLGSADRGLPYGRRATARGLLALWH